MSEVKTEHQYYSQWKESAIDGTSEEYHLVNDGMLTRKDFSILFQNEQGKRYLPVECLGSLNVYADVSFSSQFFEFANEKGVKIRLYNRYGNYIGCFEGANHMTSATVMMKQVMLYENEAERLNLAKQFLVAAIHNMRANLRYYEKMTPSVLLKEGIRKMSYNMKRIKEAKSINQLMLFEARNRQEYYHCFNEMIHPKEFSFTKRSKRPPKDPLNAMISFGNMCLYQRIATELEKHQLDIRIGYLHATNQRRTSLNLDVAEIYKPIIVDRVIFTLINKGMIKEERDFAKTKDGKGVYLNASGKRIFLQEFENKLRQRICYEGNQTTYQGLIRQECSNLFQWIANGKTYEPYRYTA